MRLWLEAEAAWAGGDLGLATRHATHMVEMASQAEHEELACLGHAIVATLARSRGDLVAEADELHRLMKRQQALRIEALASRACAVEWQMQARASADHIVRLESQSRLLERLSLEDGLTGIPNRRALDRQLLARPPVLPGAASRTCIALVDVDRFKQVNDNHSHHVGDEVLRVVADILSTAVRAGDFVARLAGDEFVVLFERATSEDAALICTRMKTAVLDHPWDGIAPGLRVSISIGLEQAQAGEWLQQLLQRSDRKMYADKRAASV